MNRNIWVISDTHFNHSNIIRYCNRPFSSLEEMNDTIVQNWNNTVKDGDIVYHLGDVYFNKHHPWMLEKGVLKGRKRLILGNHDDGKDQVLLNSFQKICMWRMFPEFGLLLTHVPVHESTLNHKCPVNIHGHIHNNKSPDKRYKNVCVEWTNYTPINIEELRVK